MDEYTNDEILEEYFNIGKSVGGKKVKKRRRRIKRKYNNKKKKRKAMKKKRKNKRKRNKKRNKKKGGNDNLSKEDIELLKNEYNYVYNILNMQTRYNSGLVDPAMCNRYDNNKESCNNDLCTFNDSCTSLLSLKPTCCVAKDIGDIKNYAIKKVKEIKKKKEEEEEKKKKHYKILDQQLEKTKISLENVNKIDFLKKFIRGEYFHLRIKKNNEELKNLFESFKTKTNTFEKLKEKFTYNPSNKINIQREDNYLEIKNIKDLNELVDKIISLIN